MEMPNIEHKSLVWKLSSLTGNHIFRQKCTSGIISITLLFQLATFQKKNRSATNPVTLKSPAIQNSQRASQKPYKHVEFIQLDNVDSIVDVRDEEGI